ncbi:hypothetical protein TNCT_712871 [Trichonephila clavata]|uniref:Uncharacterized protein n=1 Tax=Trichonephila clavata TaxID=2740835 RepID=A0A8X6G2L3_TRICU|nr:hypothetical protein TNCT_712871 [Trichonephila clavata]
MPSDCWFQIKAHEAHSEKKLLLHLPLSTSLSTIQESMSMSKRPRRTKKFENLLQLSHQMPPGDTQTSKNRYQRAGREGTRTRWKNPSTILEIHRS